MSMVIWIEACPSIRETIVASRPRRNISVAKVCGDLPTRFARLEEGLEVLTRLLRGDGPASYAGRFFQLQDAILAPRPARPGGPPIIIGGHGPRRTLPLVAQYADIWNVNTKALPAVRERAALLDRLLLAAGRRPEDVRRTVNAPVVCGRTPAELERQLRGVRRWPGFASLPLDELVAALRARQGAIIGTPAEVVAQLRACEEAGIAEVAVQWFDADDLAGLALLATEVLPHLNRQHAGPDNTSTRREAAT
jgi:alkanesulfonate monooxygenase SsuD/methylene tetrahydromethanopterin reductase-like flavin-dependent oxidoreductase (luciferase family)